MVAVALGLTDVAQLLVWRLLLELQLPAWPTYAPSSCSRASSRCWALANWPGRAVPSPLAGKKSVVPGEGPGVPGRADPLAVRIGEPSGEGPFPSDPWSSAVDSPGVAGTRVAP